MSPHQLLNFHSIMSTVAELIASYEGAIMGAKYISAVALSCLIYDHILHLNDELTDIWWNFGQKPILKFLFLLGRYCTIISVGYTAISLGIFNTDMTLQDCQVWIIVTVVFIGLALIGTEGIVIYRLRSLWHFNRPITRAIKAMVVAVFISTTVAMSIGAMEFKDVFRPVPGLPGCLFTPSSSKPFSSTLVLGVVFVIWDIFNICLFTFNTFATPYLCSSEVLNRFQKDGGRYFVYLLAVHLLYLFTSAFAQESRLSNIPLVAALTAVINTRIFHGIALETERYADEYDVTLPGSRIDKR